MTLEECQALIAAAPERGTNRWGRKTATKTTGKTAAKTTDAADVPKKKTAIKKKAAPKKKAAAKKKSPAKKSSRPG